MNYLKIATIVLIEVIFCLLFVLQADARRDPQVQFSVIFEKTEYDPKEAISIEFKLKNTGRSPIYVNKRFHVNTEDKPPAAREVSFQVTGPSGEKLPDKVFYDTGFPKTDYFVLLDPGGEVGLERSKNLQAYFDFSEAGKYKIIAVYQNVYGPEIGLDAFKDELKSKAVTIEIIENK